MEGIKAVNCWCQIGVNGQNNFGLNIRRTIIAAKYRLKSYIETVSVPKVCF